MVPFVSDPGATGDTQLASGTLRLMRAIHSRTVYRDELPRSVSLATLAKLATFDDAAVDAAVASGFVVQDDRGRLRITPAGRSIFEWVEVEADDPGDLLTALARSGSVVVNFAILARRLKQSPESLWRALGAIERDGTVDRWPDHPEGRSVALTALGAARMGLRIAPDGSRWLRKGEPDPFERAVYQPFAATETGFIGGYDDRTDPTADGLDALLLDEQVADALRVQRIEHEHVFGAEVEARRKREMREQATRKAGETRALQRETARLPAKERKARLAELKNRQMGEAFRKVLEPDTEPDTSLVVFSDRITPVPRILTGLRPSWPLMAGSGDRRHVWTPGDGPCPACQGKPLARLEACLWCNRSGIDYLLCPVKLEAKLKPATVPEPSATQARRPAKVEPPPKPTAAAWDRAMSQLESLRGGRGRKH